MIIFLTFISNNKIRILVTYLMKQHMDRECYQTKDVQTLIIVLFCFHRNIHGMSYNQMISLMLMFYINIRLYIYDPNIFKLNKPLTIRFSIIVAGIYIIYPTIWHDNIVFGNIILNLRLVLFLWILKICFLTLLVRFQYTLRITL